MIPNILSIAGSDPSGGAGIQADIKAISACGGYAMAVITALTAQNTCGVLAVEMVAPAMVRAQIAAIRADIRIDAVKIGMLGSAESAEVVADEFHNLAVPLILDPVMVAKGGNRLLSADAVAVVRARILPLATLITPNLPEAADLLNTTEADNRAEMLAQAEALLTLGPGAIMLKGGHLEGADSPDLLLTREGAVWLEGVRYATANTHGTGCTLSSAIAAELAHGRPLAEAAANAKAYVVRAIAAADQLDVGHGHGPTHHFHAMSARDPN